MASSKLAAVLLLAVALLAASALQPSQATSRATAAELTTSPSPAPSSQPSVSSSSCAPWFMGITPCMDFFTDADVRTPSSTCCKGLQSLVDGEATCLCHVMNGDIDNFMPANTDFSRVDDLPSICDVAVPVEALSNCETQPVPPLMPPSPAV